MLAFLSSLPISVSCVLDVEANKFYDSSNQLYDAARLTRGYTQHALCPYIDSEINHKCYFIKISFINILTCQECFDTIWLFHPFQLIFKILKHP